MQRTAYLSVMQSAIPHIRVAVLGASGFAGGELVRLLEAHPFAEVTFLGAHGSVGEDARRGPPEPVLARRWPRRSSGSRSRRMSRERPTSPSARCHTGRAPSWLRVCSTPDVTVIDLAGDFRLPASAYPDWYGFEHPAADWLGKAVYGLPELFGDQLPGAQLVANPGCFPTPVILGLSPLLSAGLVEPGPIHVDGKTGLSGAGRTASDADLVRGVGGERSPVPRSSASAHARDGARARAGDRVHARRACSCRTWCRRSAAW